MSRLYRVLFSFLILFTLTITKSIFAQTYQAVILHPSGAYNSAAWGISDGQPVGIVFDGISEQIHAVLWSGLENSYVDLNPSGFYYSSYAKAVSDGQIVGAAYPLTENDHALLWFGISGSYVDLHPSGFEYSRAEDISDNKQVGYGAVKDGQGHALLWSGSANSCVDLNPSGFQYSRCNGISGNQQVGCGCGDATGGDMHALLWSGSAGSYIDLNPNGFTNSSANKTSGTQQVGWGWGGITGGNCHALLWSGTASNYVDLNPSGCTRSEAKDIFGGQQVGCGFGNVTGNKTHAFVWSGDSKSYVDLHDYLPSKYMSSVAEGIDSSGNIVGYAGTEDDHSHAVMWIPNDLPPDEDADGDGLLNGWETNGYDYNNDGIIDLDLPALGANPRHKDLFVEVDAMIGRAPTQAALNRVVTAFTNSPVDNPDGVNGISLHIQLDETNIPLADWPNAFAGFDNVKDDYYGTPTQRNSTNWSNIRNAKAKVYRYCIFANTHSGGTSSGYAEVPGNDFMVTLGGWSPPGGTQDQQVGTFMHEFGHNLNLSHGGDDNINYKPNYHSIMNYHWQFPRIGYTGWTLDYSRETLPTLRESNLNETIGIGGAANTTLPVGPLRTVTVNERGPVDWNRDGDTQDIGVGADINYVGGIDGGPSPGQVLNGYNDWPSLWYKLSGRGNFNDGVHEIATMHEELTFEEYKEIYETIDGIYFDPNEPNTLKIENFVKYFYTDPNKPHANQGLLTYVEKAGNLNEIDTNDIFYTDTETISSKIVSLIPVWNLDRKIIDYNSLSKDYRPFPTDPNDPNSNGMLDLSIFNPEPNEPNQPNDPNIISENYLKFWLAPNAFKGKPVTIQQVSPDPNIFEYPVWDIRNIINKNNRQLPLEDIISSDVDPNVLLEPNCILDPNTIVKIIEPNVPYAWFTLSTHREIIDINDNGIIEYNDYLFLLEDLGKEGIFRTDIASMKNNSIVLGIPDGKVDETDENAFVTEYNKRKIEPPIEAEDIFENFESGQIEEPFTTSGNKPWIISDDHYKGNYSVKSGSIKDNQSSILEATIDAPEGNISFWRRVSSESGCDELIFYIDGEEIVRWSGLLDWEEVSGQVNPGSHTLKWEYKKDDSVSIGEDAAWIDEIVIQ